MTTQDEFGAMCTNAIDNPGHRRGLHRITTVCVPVGIAIAVAALGVRTLIGESLKIDSFLGEKFGRVLSCDVERKKLAEPIGVVDEVMLQTDGDPSRQLNCIYGYKFLGDVSEEEADRLAEEACASLQKLGRFTLKERAPHGRVGFLKAAYSREAYAFVQWDDHFFQQGKVLRLGIGRNVDNPVDLNLHVDEVSGYKIGVPAGGDGKPRTPFWKFERIVNEVGANGIVNGVHVLHDVSALSLEDAAREFEEARRSVERLLGITMFKSLDYDEVKVYECYGEDVHVFVKMEYLNNKQIRCGVMASGKWLSKIQDMPLADGWERQMDDRNNAVLLLCIVVLCGGLLMLMMRRNKNVASEAKTLR